MFSIGSERLRVTFVDPAKDRERLGTRFCAGGWIFQVTDRKTGRDLMAGPTYPGAFNTFDGQGIPDAFHRIPLMTGKSSLAVIPGIGKVDLRTDTVAEFDEWTITKEESSCLFETRHTLNDIDIILRRRVTVEGARITSSTEIGNRGDACIPFAWYPHAFWPPMEIGKVIMELPEDAVFDNPTGYFSNERGKIRRVAGIGQELSFQPTVFPGRDHTEVLFHTPAYDAAMVTDFRSHSVPIWANDSTFSAEPYYERTVFPGCSVSWSVTYRYYFLKDQ